MYLGAIGGRGGAQTSSTVLTDVNCFGNESSLLDCAAINSSDCISQEIATVTCQGSRVHCFDSNFSIFFVCLWRIEGAIVREDCRDGDIRLVNGSNRLEGRVEVCFNNVWGTICDERFNSDDALVICNQLSLPFESMHVMNVQTTQQCSNLTIIIITIIIGSVALTGAFFGRGDGPIFIESLTCEGNERSILGCNEINMRRGMCTHDRDVSVRCTG